MGKVLSIDGLPVVDAKRPLVLRVTKADIVKAADSSKEPEKCAVARACYRELRVQEVRVHLARVYLRTNKTNWVRYLTPKDMRAEIIAFDRGGQFEPGEFRLVPVSPAMRFGVHRSVPSTNSGKGKKHKKYHLITNVRGGPATQ